MPLNRKHPLSFRRARIEILEHRLLLSVGLLTTDQDIGVPQQAGSASYSDGVYTLSAGGNGLGGASDQFNFASASITGDCTVTALLSNLSGGGPSASAGVMIRADTTAGAIFAAVQESSSGVVSFAWRNASGASASSSAPVNVAAPVWLKLVDASNTFNAFDSTDGVHWTQIGLAQSIAMPSAIVLAGLWASSNSNASLSSASFSNVSLMRGGWGDGDVGAPSLAGSGVYDAPSDTFTLSGNGSDIYGTSDQFNFAFTAMSGDGSATAYVDSISNADPWAKAGVMMRADTSASSAFAGVFISAQNGIVFEWRPSDGASVQQEVSAPPGGPVLAPASLMLTRSSASTFSAYYSTDGINWTLIGPAQTVSMPSLLDAGLAVTSHNSAALCTASFSSVGIGATLQPAAGVYSASDQLFLDDLEMREAQFFYNETNANTGLIPDNANANGGSPSGYSSIAAIGFGLTSLTIADARGWLSHSAAYQRALTTLNFLYSTGASMNGFFYHFLDPATGARTPGSELSSIDTAELMAGVLSAGQYWLGTPLQQVATNLYNRVNWPWMQQPGGVFYGAWTPESGFSGGYGDFSEAVVLYLMGLGSRTHPVSRASWNSWSRSPSVTYGGYHFITADDAALFTVQYPMAWFDLRGLSDSTGLNYYQNAATATLAQRQWMTDLSSTYPDYGPNLWGLTPSDSAHGYAVWGGPPASGPIDGTVVPTGPGGSLEFTPRQSINALEHMKQQFGGVVYKKYGLIDSFNPLTSFISSLVLGIDVGMTIVSAENARSEFVWNYFNQNSVARQSLASAFPSIAPQLIAAASRKTTPGFLVVDLPIQLSGSESIENRAGGPTQLVLTFEAKIVQGPNFAVSISTPTGPAVGQVTGTSINGTALTINLSGVADAQSLIVTLTDVRHFSTSASGDYTVDLGVLLADTNQDGTVNALDFNALASNFGGTGKNSSQGDLNVDGVVNTQDFTLLASAFGERLAMPATVSSASPMASGPADLFTASPTQKHLAAQMFDAPSVGRIDY